MFKRLISTSRICVNRHPPIKLENVTTDFAPEFQVNKVAAERVVPWVPKPQRKLAARARKQKLIKARFENRLNKALNEVRVFAVEGEDEQVNIDPTANMDPMAEYRQRVAEYRKRYADEMQMKLEAENLAAEEMEKAKKQEGTDEKMSALSVEQEALNFLLDISHKQLKEEKFRKARKELSEKNLEAITRLYHSANSFITPDNLDEQIDACLRRISPHVSLTRQDMIKMREEGLKLSRDMQLFDAFSDTLMGKESVNARLTLVQKQKEKFAQHSQHQSQQQ